MRRRPGISGLQHGRQALEQYKQKGEEVRKNNLEAMREQLTVFRSSLEQFAHKYKDEIRKDPVFRAKFHTMCANIGVDPLVSNKGMWAQLLGLGDFYYELGVQVVEACMATRELNGGLLDLVTLHRLVLRRRGSLADPISPDDIIQAVKKLKVLGGGFDLVKIGQQQYIRSVPGELNTDKNKILEVAQGTGYVSEKGLQGSTGWTSTRISIALQALLQEGLALVDDGAPDSQRLYWFPCVGGLLQA
jgi:ESCRT-II complex subunit VPS22